MLLQISADAVVESARPGQIVATGTPEDVAKVKVSYTGQYLHELLGRRTNARNDTKRHAAE